MGKRIVFWQIWTLCARGGRVLLIHRTFAANCDDCASKEHVYVLLPAEGDSLGSPEF